MRTSVYTLLVLGCSSGPKEDAVPPQRTGSWVAVDLHVHSSVGSNDTDGLSPIADVAAVARDRGLSMVVITDHSNSAGSMGCSSGDVEDCPNQGPEFPAIAEAIAASDEQLELAVGVEISPVASLEFTSEPTGHIGCIPPSITAFEGVASPVIDRPVGAVDGGSGIAWCHAQGGLAVVNHPYTLAGWLNYDWSSMDYDAIEVFNGGARFDAGDWDAVQSWACDVSLGRRVVAVGGSDAHRAATPSPPEGPLDQAIGFPITWVWQDDDSSLSLLEALWEGRTIVADPRTQLDVWAVYDGDRFGPGQRMAARPGQFSLHVETTVDQSGLRLEVLDLFSGACTDDLRRSHTEAPVVSPNLIHVEDLAAGESRSLQLMLSTESVERVVVWIRPIEAVGIGHDGFALASPIFVDVH